MSKVKQFKTTDNVVHDIYGQNVQGMDWDDYELLTPEQRNSDIAYFVPDAPSGLTLVEQTVPDLPAAVASFSNAVDVLLKTLKVSIVPVQAGSGDPSPSNPRPISGWSSVGVTVADDTTDPTTEETYEISLGQTVYGGTLNVTTGELTVDRVEVDMGNISWNHNSINSVYKPISEMKVNSDIIGSELETVPQSTSSDAMPSGSMRVATDSNNVVVKLDGITVQNAQSMLSGMQLVYELTTPITIQLTPTQVNSILGVNNIWADCGQVNECTYYIYGQGTKPQLYFNDDVYVGSEVIANPEDAEATEKLNKLAINGIVYDINPNVGERAIIDKLYEASNGDGAPLTTAINYTGGHKLSDYDIITVTLCDPTTYTGSIFSQVYSFSPKSLKSSGAQIPYFPIIMNGINDSECTVFFNENSFTVISHSGDTGEEPSVYSVYGLKFNTVAITEDIAGGDWTSLISQTGGLWSTATALPDGTTHVAVFLEYNNNVDMPFIFSVAEYDKIAQLSGNSIVQYGLAWKIGSDYDDIAYEYDSANGTVAVYAAYSGITIKAYAIAAKAAQIDAPIMQGATSSADGDKGLVPTPLMGDEDKYLKGDGSWGEVQTPLTFDNVPTASSNNPVKSGGVYSALSSKQDAILQLPEATSYTNGMYYSVASETGGTEKISVDEFSNSLSSAFSSLNDYEIIKYQKNKVIKTNTNPINLEPVTLEGFYCALVPCVEGDVFEVTGRGGTSAHYLTFTDADGNIILDGDVSVDFVENLIVVAPQNAEYLILNNWRNYGHEKCIKNPSIYKKNSFDESLFEVGGINPLTGESATSNRLRSKNYISADVAEIFASSTNKVALFAYYPNGNYKGELKADKTGFKTSGNVIWHEKINFATFSGNVFSQELKYKIVVETTSLDDISQTSKVGNILDSIRKNFSDIDELDDAIKNLSSDSERTRYNSDKYFMFDDSVSLAASTTDLFELYDNLVEDYPHIVSKNTLTSGNLTNYEYIFSTPNYNVSGQRSRDAEIEKPQILITTGVHGDEKSSIMSTYTFFKMLCENAFPISGILEKCNFRVIPCVTQWGFNNNKRWNENGVNINRNFDASWTYQGEPYTNGYSGENAASEDETKIVQNWINAHNTESIMMIDFHNSAYTNEVSYFSTLNNETTLKIKNNYRMRIDDSIGYWKEIRKMRSNSLIYGYTGYTITSGGCDTYGNQEGILSALLETSWDQNSFGQHSNKTIGIGCEVLSIVLLSIIKSLVE